MSGVKEGKEKDPKAEAEQLREVYKRAMSGGGGGIGTAQDDGQVASFMEILMDLAGRFNEDRPSDNGSNMLFDMMYSTHTKYIHLLSVGSWNEERGRGTAIKTYSYASYTGI
jgi:hypothetical protein